MRSHTPIPDAVAVEVLIVDGCGVVEEEEYEDERRVGRDFGRQ